MVTVTYVADASPARNTYVAEFANAAGATRSTAITVTVK